MRCAVNRWGPGTTCERPNNSEAAKILQDKLTQMKHERSAQDKMWETDVKDSNNLKMQPQTQTIKQKIHVRDNILYSS